METDNPSSGQFGNQNYLRKLETGNRTDTGYTELSREVAPPPKNGSIHH